MTERTEGPWDISEIDLADDVERLDLGALRVVAAEGVDVQVQVDETTGTVVQLTFARADGAVQVQPYAAPRSGGLWDDVRSQLKSSINQGGGLVEESSGSFGTELRAQIKADGSNAMQPARFVGMEGPRWFLRAVFLGAATKPGPTTDILETHGAQPGGRARRRGHARRGAHPDATARDRRARRGRGRRGAAPVAVCTRTRDHGDEVAFLHGHTAS